MSQVPLHCQKGYMCSCIFYSGNDVCNVKGKLCKFRHPGESHIKYMKRLGYEIEEPEEPKPFTETYKYAYSLTGNRDRFPSCDR